MRFTTALGLVYLKHPRTQTTEARHTAFLMSDIDEITEDKDDCTKIKLKYTTGTAGTIVVKNTFEEVLRMIEKGEALTVSDGTSSPSYPVHDPLYG